MNVTWRFFLPSSGFLNMHLNTTLLREKFIIRESAAKDQNNAEKELWACSNRILLDLQTENLEKETFIIRTDSMHLCARMAGYILADYENRGPFTPRLENFKWDILWNSILSDYERRYNSARWVSIYHKGNLVFSEGSHHAFFDIIEKFENTQEKSYSKSLKKAEKAFSNAGKEVIIDYASNIALSIKMNHKGGRCSTILRTPNKTTAFNFYLTPHKKREKVVVSQSLTSTADFLEGTNLAYFVGITKARIECNIVEKYSDEARQMRNALRRISDINIKIDSLERRYLVRYRPERPMFDLIIKHTQNYAKRLLLEDQKAFG